MTNQEILIVCIIICIILYFIFFNIKHIKNYYKFLLLKCKKGICYENINKCYSPNGYIYSDTSNDNKIERKTLKCILDINDKYRLLNLENIFIPSLMNGTFCDILYTTYYDYNDFTLLKNRINTLNMPLTKCIRIRHYHFQPGTYFEIKYNGGTKIRALIDKNYDLLEENKLDKEYKDIITNILDKIKSKKVMPIFQNVYKRMSFIYKNEPSIRITIDSNIEFFYNNIYNSMDKDILEIKIPTNINIYKAQEYLDEINNLAGTKLKYTSFSKFEYYYYDVIMRQ
jgi:hypothetical protein